MLKAGSSTPPLPCVANANENVISNNIHEDASNKNGDGTVCA